MTDYTTYTDEQLLAYISKDDEKAFNILYRRFWKPLYAVAYKRLDNVPDTEEAVQNVFIRLWNRRNSLQLKYTLSTYLTAAVQYEVIAIRARRDKWQEQSATLRAIPGYGEISQNNTQEQLDVDDLQEQMHQTLNTLPERSRLIFLKNREQEQTYSAIAQELNISQKAVEKHMTRTLARLRTALTSLFYHL